MTTNLRMPKPRNYNPNTKPNPYIQQLKQKQNKQRMHTSPNKGITGTEVKIFVNYLLIPGLIIFGLYLFCKYAGKEPIEIYQGSLFVFANILSLIEIGLFVFYQFAKGKSFPSFSKDGLGSFLGLVFGILFILYFFNAAILRVINSTFDFSKSTTVYVKILDKKCKTVVTRNRGTTHEREYCYLTISSWISGRKTLTFETSRDLYCHTSKDNIFKVVYKPGLLGFMYIAKFDKVTGYLPDNTVFPLTEEQYDKAKKEKELEDSEKRKKKQEEERIKTFEKSKQRYKLDYDF